MQIDAVSSINPVESTDSFVVSYLPGVTVFGQIRGTLTVSASSLVMKDFNDNEIFTLPAISVASIKDELSGVRIKTQSKNFRLLFRDAQKGALKILVLGPVFGSGGKNGMFSSEVQAKCKGAIDSLIRHGYTVITNQKRST